MSEVRYPKARHIDCRDSKCKICFEDGCALLGDFFDKETGNVKEDHLGKYHSFLSANNINPETEWGWWSKEAFEKENLDAYVEYKKETP